MRLVRREEIPKDLRCFVTTGRSYDGIENVDDGNFVELCAKCSATLIQDVARNDFRNDYAVGKAIVAWVGQRKKKR